MTLELAISILAFSAPITVAIVKFVPRKASTDSVSQREFDLFRSEIRTSLGEIRKDVRDIRRTLLGP